LSFFEHEYEHEHDYETGVPREVSRCKQEIPLPASHFFTMSSKSLAQAIRLGVCGGTFDPVHYGHLAIAEEARQQFSLDAVLFIPSGEPPHKPRWQADAELRYQMVQLATADHPAFYVSRIEIDRSGPSYTAETLRALHRQYPRAHLFFIMGADSALDFHRWRDPLEITQLAQVIAATRPGFSLEALGDTPLPIAPLPMPGLDISSTDLRARIRAGNSVRYLVPNAVAAFIEKMGMYERVKSKE
jgi:nicotinate-nucleotide adenylyltransferase